MQQAALIFFGWVLGVFHSIFLENKKRKQAKEDYKESLFTEFDLVYPRIVTTYFTIIDEMGELNREKLEWMLNIISKKNSESLDNVKDKTINILRYNDEQIKSMNKKPHDTQTLFLKKFNLSFLQENISSFSLLDKEFRYNAINIRTNINFLNDCIDKVYFFYKATFIPDLSKSLQDISYINVNNYYIQIRDLCKSTSEMIVSINEKRKKIY